MQADRGTAFRLALAEGFLREAEQDFELGRWRSCVDNAQLAVENSGKAVLALFGVSPKTHDPAREIAALLRMGRVAEPLAGRLRQMLPDLLALGQAEHLLTDYGDEASYRLPWEIFTAESAEEALGCARKAAAGAREAVALMTSDGLPHPEPQ